MRRLDQTKWWLFAITLALTSSSGISATTGKARTRKHAIRHHGGENNRIAPHSRHVAIDFHENVVLPYNESSRDLEMRRVDTSSSDDRILDCPSDSMDYLNDEREYNDNNDDAATALFSKYSQGGIAVNIVKWMRRGSPEIYRDLIDNAIMATCDFEGDAKLRCVDAESSFAAKDWNGTCVVALDTSEACPSPTDCERTSNCYWKPVVAGQDRETRYLPSQYPLATENIVGYQMSAEQTSYAGQLGQMAVFGIALAVLSFVMWFIYIIGRTCCCFLFDSCCRLCSSKPRVSGYACCFELGVPIFVYFLGLMGIACCGVLAFIGNYDIDRATTATFFHSSELVQDAKLFLLRTKIPLVNVNLLAEAAALEAELIFEGTDFVTEGASEIVDLFGGFITYYNDSLVQAGASDIMEDAFGEFNSSVTPVAVGIQVMLDALETELFGEGLDLLQQTIDTGIVQMDATVNETRKTQDQIDDFKVQETSFRTIRKGVILVAFALGFTVTFLGFGAMICSNNKRTNWLFVLINIAWLVNALLATIAILVGTILLTVNFLVVDACEVLNILVANDLEPVVGEQLSPYINAVFNDTNLAEAFNVTDKLNFEEQLNAGLAILDANNITEQFDMVLEPLDGFGDALDNATDTALESFNSITGGAGASVNCPINDIFAKEYMLTPWAQHENRTDMTTEWYSYNTGTPKNYARASNAALETNVDYMDRVYGDVAGKCTSSVDCCLNGSCLQTPGNWCNSGDDCVYMCAPISAAAAIAYPLYLEGVDSQTKMKADLGLYDDGACPTGYSCPTGLFSDSTVIAVIGEYETNLTDVAIDLVSVATSTIGDMMIEVQDFLCNMNISFAERRYRQVHTDLCVDMQGGFAQITFGVWILAAVLQLVAILGAMLSIRLQGPMGRGGGDDDYDTEDTTEDSDPYCT